MSITPPPALPWRIVQACLRILGAMLLAGLSLWATAAVYFSNLPAAWLRMVAAGLYALAVIAVWRRVRPAGRARLLVLAAFAGVLVWFLLIPPSNDRDWQPDVALLPSAEVNGDHVTIHHIRNCDYRTETDYTVAHYDRTFDLAKLQTLDFY